jgi:hypothetical protein
MTDKHVLCNKNQALKVFDVWDLKCCKGTAGIILPVIHNSLAFSLHSINYDYGRLSLIKIHHYIHIWRKTWINFNGFSETCDSVPQQNEGEDSALIEHLYLLVDKWLANEANVMWKSGVWVWVVVSAYVSAYVVFT